VYKARVRRSLMRGSEPSYGILTPRFMSLAISPLALYVVGTPFQLPVDTVSPSHPPLSTIMRATGRGGRDSGVEMCWWMCWLLYVLVLPAVLCLRDAN
jgi:hypothetical protein